ncbi:MAG TPA: sugar phosphate isomerase/epimerase family protein [Bryobacteraceae bacterium]|nr:sugar phosphate isomerase/epimerase family protein [Bryobacteraceae bacterium]
MERNKRETDGLSRRDVLAAGAALLGAGTPAGAAENKAGKQKLKVAVFSKHLQFLQGEEMAKAAADTGFDGVDITVRNGGHVAPERVRQDLPPLVASIRKHGLEVPMITTDIVDTATPYTEDILKAMSELGIHNYRWGGLKYTPDGSLAAQLEQMKPRVAKLAALNSRYKAGAMYHTHSGIGMVGASFWDLHILLKDQDPAAVGVNYDIGHATVEGGFGGWINSFRITGAHVRGIAVKDVLWGKDAKGAWRPQWKPLGEGMVRFPQFFKMVADAGFAGPLQIHYEYPLGGADGGKTKLTSDPAEVFAAMKRDLKQLRAYLSGAGLV